jgi:hypothetical protein
MHVYKTTSLKIVLIFQLQKSIVIYLVYTCCSFFYRCVFIQVENFNIFTNLAFYFVLWHINNTQLHDICKKLQCNAKSHQSR